MRHDVQSMGGIGSRIALGLAVAIATLGAVTGAAQAAATIQSDPTEYTFLPGSYTQGLGEVATFDNSLATSYHDVVTDTRGPDGGALFYSVMIPGGQVTPVKGTQYLTAGNYPFYCSLHGKAMSGELTIENSGKVMRRPSVAVSFVNQTLKQVRRAGVKVKIKAATASNGVSVTAKKGKALIGSKRALNFKAGQTRVLTIPLTKAGRKAISKGKVVPISLRAAVEFGKPSNATRRVK